MQKQIVINIDRCTGCASCELACSFAHHGEFNPLKSRIHTTIFLEKAVAIPVVCYQCNDAWCARVCPSDAITVDDDPEGGATLVTVHEDKCIGCRMCMEACPFGNVVVTGKGKKATVEKCDLCDGDPECVKVCRTKALKFETPLKERSVEKCRVCGGTPEYAKVYQTKERKEAYKVKVRKDKTPYRNILDKKKHTAETLLASQKEG